MKKEDELSYRAVQIADEYQTMIRLGEKWSTCKVQHEFYVNAAVFLEMRHSGFACIHLPIIDTG